MTLRVEQGKGRKDRYAMLSPVLLERLRAWWRVGHAQGKILPGGWLFPGLDPMDPLTARQLNRAVHAAADAAGIDKRVTTHTLRHCLRHPPAGAEGRHPRHPGAARPQEAGDHQPSTPHVATDLLREVISPLEEPAAFLRPASWGGPPWRSPTSSVPTDPPGVTPSAAT